MTDAGHQLSLLIRAEIQASGPLSCARFMELALYHPVYGYYRRSFQQIGCQGDFYTSVSVGPLFGQLLACHFSRAFDQLVSSGLAVKPQAPPARPGVVPSLASVTHAQLHLLEAGAHDGKLAFDVLSWLQAHRPDLLSQIRYLILEPSPAMRQVQTKLLEPFIASVTWFDDWEHLPVPALRGVIFSNELLDAFPVFRIGWDSDRHQWFEWQV